MTAPMPRIHVLVGGAHPTWHLAIETCPCSADLECGVRRSVDVFTTDAYATRDRTRWPDASRCPVCYEEPRP